MSNVNYYDVPALSVSGINAFHRSPMHYWKESPFNPDKATRKDSPAMLLGKVAHKLILEYDTFYDEFAVAPICDKRTKAGKAEFAAFEAQSTGKTLVDLDIHIKATAMFDALQNNSAVRKLMSVGESEKPLFWHNGFINCKAKADRYRDGLLIDYKTTDNASLKEFSRSIEKWGYHRQDAWYMEGFKTVHNERPRGFVFIVQEKDIPENIGIYSLSESDRKLGKMENDSISREIVERLSKGHWTSYPEMILNVSLPNWYAS